MEKGTVQKGRGISEVLRKHEITKTRSAFSPPHGANTNESKEYKSAMQEMKYALQRKIVTTKKNPRFGLVFALLINERRN